MIVSLCSGYGGLDRAVAAAFRVPIAAHAEPEKIYVKTSSWRAGEKSHYKKPIPNPVLAVLEARFPGVPNLGDITAVDWTPWRSHCTILCAGFPCQPFSAAGRQGGEDDERYLWPSVHRAIVELDPEWVVLENVANIISIRGGEIWATILRDLRKAGYDVAWGIFGACLVGACHHRHRMFLVARRGRSADAIRWPGKPCGIGKNLTLPTPTSRDWRLTGPSEINVRNSPNLSALPLLLPTPAARDGDARGTSGNVERRLSLGRDGESGVRKQLDLAVAVQLLPTPRATDHTMGHNSRKSDGGMNGLSSLPSPLLPTPRATDGTNGGPSQRGSSGDLAMGAAVQPQNYGRFAWAVDRWADAFGSVPPAPTETGMPGQRGGTRMAAPFPEWMMGLRPGYVTNILPRNDALRAIGNGVMPQQGYAAVNVLRAMLA